MTQHQVRLPEPPRQTSGQIKQDSGVCNQKSCHEKWRKVEGAGAIRDGRTEHDTRLAVMASGTERQPWGQPSEQIERLDWTTRQDSFEDQGTDPDAMLNPGSARAGQARRDPRGQEDQRDLPQGVENIAERIKLQSFHSPPPSSSSRRVNSAIRLGSICLVLMRLITSSSLEPPNILSTRSRRAWPDALASLTA